MAMPLIVVVTMVILPVGGMLDLSGDGEVNISGVVTGVLLTYHILRDHPNDCVCRSIMLERCEACSD